MKIRVASKQYMKHRRSESDIRWCGETKLCDSFWETTLVSALLTKYSRVSRHQPANGISSNTPSRNYILYSYLSIFASNSLFPAISIHGILQTGSNTADPGTSASLFRFVPHQLRGYLAQGHADRWSCVLSMHWM